MSTTVPPKITEAPAMQIGSALCGGRHRPRPNSWQYTSREPTPGYEPQHAAPEPSPVDSKPGAR